MHVMVTGGAGFIGSHTAKSLAKADITPVTYDNLSTGFSEAVRWGPFVEGDLADEDCIRATIREYRIQAVFHFAASAYVGESIRDPRGYFQNNVTGTLNLLNAMQDTDVRQIVFSSSCATYGVPNKLPVDESSPQQPINPYGDSKLFVERVLHWYGNTYGLRWAVLRYFNAAGADADGEIGEDHNPETHIIPLTMQAALGVRPHFDVFGTDHPTPDGTAIRDYVHVEDLAYAHVLALEYMMTRSSNLTLNLSAQRGYSIRDVIAEVERVSGLNVPFRVAPKRIGDPPVLVGTSERARTVLGWHPEKSEIRTIVESAWAWQKFRYA